MRAGEQMSDDEEEGQAGMGLRLLQLMQQNSSADELIEAFNAALNGPPPPLEIEGGIYVAPPEGSTEVYWAPIEIEAGIERARIEERHRKEQSERREEAIRAIRNNKDGNGGDAGEDDGGVGLTSLVLERLGIDDDESDQVCRQVASCTSLTTLSLSLNHIGPTGCRSIVTEALPSLSALTELSLGYNKIGNEGAYILAHGLYDECPHIKTLLLQGNEIGPAFPVEFLSLPALDSLSLRGNRIETAPRGIATTFNQLDLSDNGPALAAHLAAELEEEVGLAKARHLRKEGGHAITAAWKLWQELDLPGANRRMRAAERAFEEAGASQDLSVMHLMEELRTAIEIRERALGEGFKPNRHDMTQLMVSESVERALRSVENGARELSLYAQMCGDAGLKSIAKEMEAKSTPIAWLDLSRCDIGPEGIKELAERFIGKTGTLKTLWLSKNRLGDEGATNLAIGLERNTSLAMLDLEHNNIRGDGAMRVAHSLKSNPSFRALCAAFNWIGDKGGVEVAGALKNMCNLQEVDVSGSGVGRAGSKALSNEFRTHASILCGKLWR
jgi:Ran GTPase-activating protein (RanGAP) involved in mRNA processing and transport